MPHKRRTNSSLPKISIEALDALIDEATIDAYGEYEQATGFHCMLSDHLALPFKTTVLGAPVIVTALDIDDDGIQLIALCQHGRQQQKIRLIDLPLPQPPPMGFEWIAAYCHWLKSGGFEAAE